MYSYKFFGVFIIVLVYLFSCICLLSCVSLRGICGVWKTYPSKMLMFSAKKKLKSLQEKADKFHLAKNLYNIFLPLHYMYVLSTKCITILSHSDQIHRAQPSFSVMT